MQVATVFICTYLQGSPMDYEYTAIKTEQQAEENMMGVIRARTRNANRDAAKNNQRQLDD